MTSESDKEIEDAFDEIAAHYNFLSFDRSSDQVFESSGLDIYCFALSYVGYDKKAHSELITVYSY